MKTVLVIGGVAAAAGLAYFLINKKQQQQLQQTYTAPSASGATANAPATTLPQPPAVKQTMWKDKDGNVFQLTSDMQKWGYVIKVNGAVHKKWNQMMTMFLGPEGHVIGADNNGSVFVWKNNQWNYVIKDNKTTAGQYLVDHGQPNIYNSLKGFAGLASAYVLN